MSNNESITHTISHNTIVIDGKIFENAEIKNNLLIYRGGIAPRFINCSVVDNQIMFEGSALNTVQFLQFLIRISSLEDKNHWKDVLGFNSETENAD